MSRGAFLAAAVAAGLGLSACAGTGVERLSPYQLGLNAQRQGRLEEATADLERAVASDPSDPVRCEALASVFSVRGWRVRARQQWQRTLSESDDGALAKGEASGRGAAWASAALRARGTALKALLKDYLDQGAASEAQALWADAAAAYRNALALDPGNPVAWPGLARASDRLGDRAEACAAWRRCFELFPKDAGVAGAYGAAAHALGLYADALEAYRRRVGLSPDARDWNNEATVLVELGRFGESMPLFDKALALDPTLIQALDGKGGACYYLGRYREARALWAHALDLAPGDATATRDMHTLVTMGY